MPKLLHPEQALFTPLSGPEIETLADYVGQGALGVQYTELVKGHTTFHPIPKAYDNEIAISDAGENALCMSTDSNRSEEGSGFPMRTCIEFRSGPQPEMTTTLLHLVKTYATWLVQQKNDLRRDFFIDYTHPLRQEKMRSHYLKIRDFVDHYNRLRKTKEQLSLSSPESVFHLKNAGPEFNFSFSDDAEWVIKLDYEDLAPNIDIVFFAQYNLSIPIGSVFSPDTKNACTLQSQFSLLNNEKEIAADFNESRPHLKLRDYEQQVFTKSVRLADEFSKTHEVPSFALGLRDFFRGMTFELAMISTSQLHLMRLFQEEALCIAQAHQKHFATQNGSNSHEKLKAPKDHDVQATAQSLANTLRKSLFSYFMKTTLAEFFKKLHPYEKDFAKSIDKKSLKSLCQQAIKLANGGLGNTQGHDSHFLAGLGVSSFIQRFEKFYQQVFNEKDVPLDEYPVDPITCLTERLLPPNDIGIKGSLPAVVVEIRQPEQGNQQYDAIASMCKKYSKTHHTLLNNFYQKNQQTQAQLDALWVKQKEEKKGHSTQASFFAHKKAQVDPLSSTTIKTKPSGQFKESCSLFSNKRVLEVPEMPVEKKSSYALRGYSKLQ